MFPSSDEILTLSCLFGAFLVLNNLLSNAIKFTDEGCVSLSVERCKDDDFLEFCVSDHGKGIPQDLLGEIFEPFRQVELADAREHGGSGLGLTICRKLVEMMGGDLRVESCTKAEGENHGSKFVFTLPNVPAEKSTGPLAKSEPLTKANGPSSHRRTRSSVAMQLASSHLRCCKTAGTVLLAEDDSVSRKIATRMLEKAGCEVLAAQDGSIAVSMFEEHHERIGLVLTDIVMPVMDSYQVTENIRAVEKKMNAQDRVPVIALSAGAMKGDEERGLAAGMCKHLTKPINRAELLKTLHVHLGQETECAGCAECAPGETPRAA